MHDAHASLSTSSAPELRKIEAMARLCGVPHLGRSQTQVAPMPPAHAVRDRPPVVPSRPLGWT